MKLDRALQKILLDKLASQYPEQCFDVIKDCGVDRPSALANLFYLTEHKLVEARFSGTSGSFDLAGRQRITAKGLDFLTDDGGMSAILGVVTIKFHEDALKDLIEIRLQNSPIPEEEKSSLIQALRELPGESIKHLTTKLLDAGLENLPRAVEILRTILP